MDVPKNGVQLQQRLCAPQWMRRYIPEFSKRNALLLHLLETVYSTAGRQKEQAVVYASLTDIECTADRLQVWENCQHSLGHQVQIAHCDVSKELFVFTDASYLLWVGIFTQIPNNDLQLSYSRQRHETLPFLSGHFNTTQLWWATLQKAIIAVLSTIKRMHRLITTPKGLHLFTNHKNSIFNFDYVTVVSDLCQTSVRKVLRREVVLSTYNYLYHDISRMIMFGRPG